MTVWIRLYKTALVIIFTLNLSLAANIPEANDINCIIEQSQTIYRNFMKQSFMIRMQLEYKEKFFNSQDKENLRLLAQKASTELNQLIDKQEKLKQAIEDYSGDDWEQKFGENRLFRRLANNISLSRENMLKTDFVTAIACDEYNKNRIFKNILNVIESDPNPGEYVELLRAKIYANLSKVDIAYFDTAKKELSKLFIRSNILQETDVETLIEDYKLTYDKPEQRDGILNYELPSPLANDPEFVLPVVFLQRKLDENAFEKWIAKNPEIKPILGALVLADLDSKADFEDITTFEVKLAVLSAWNEGAVKYNKLLESLCSVDKFKTPLVLYVTAISYAETKPEESVKLLIDASKMQKNNFDKMLNIEPATAASQGCLLAYKTFAKEKADKELTVLTFENYFQLAEGDTDQKIKYLYCGVLNSLGEQGQSRELLEEISNDDASSYRCQAKYDLITDQIQSGSQAGVIEKIEELIYDSRDANQPKTELEATRIYCRLVLNSTNKDKAGKVLSVLKNTQINFDDEIFIFIAKAYLLTDGFVESTQTMLKLEAKCGYCGEVLDIFEHMTDFLDRMQYKQAELIDLEENCRKLFAAFDSCFDKSQKSIALLYLTEISVFSNQGDALRLGEIEKQMDFAVIAGSIEEAELIRCQARLAMYQQKFAQAGNLWGKFCDLSKNKGDLPTELNDRWWQGKYYQLYCFKNSPDAKQSELLHIIEVLERTYPDREQFWDLKISYLK